MKRSNRSSVDYAMRTQHVWRQGRKVTPFAGSGYYLRSYYGRWVGSQEQAERWHKYMLTSCKLETVGARASPVTNVHSSHDGWFRLVNEHGKPYGRRYIRTNRWREDPAKRGWGWVGDREYGCFDQFGNEAWIKGSARVRYVAQQPEDYHSYASRVLTRAHKLED